MTLEHGLLLLAAGGLAGLMNAVAGGGSFVSLPALIGSGLPALVANTSNTVALLPGVMVSARVYRRHVQPIGALGLRTVVIVSAAGGLLGAVLLLATPTRVFDQVLPWLLLVATLTLVFGGRLRLALARRHLRIDRVTALALHLLLGVYGGYFGGGVGFMVLALWALVTDQDLKELTPARVLVSLAMNGVAAVYFLLAGAVRWPQTIAILLGALLGGHLGAHIGRRLPAAAIRLAVMLVSAATTAAFFWRAWA